MHLEVNRLTDYDLPYKRSIIIKLFSLFHNACDTRKILIAQELLSIVNNLLMPPASHPKEQRRFVELSVAAHERLWLLLHQET